MDSEQRFHTTRWSLVLAAAGEARDEAVGNALSELCRAYWAPLYAYGRRMGRTREDSEDDVQGFLSDLLARGNLAEVAPDKGRFRSFMLVAFKHFVLNQIDKGKAQKRGGDREFVPFELAQVESWLAGENEISPTDAFDRQWAFDVLARALERVEKRYAGTGKIEQFNALRGLLTGGQTASYAKVGETCGLTEGAVKVAAHRLRQRYQGALREVIAETVTRPADIDDELRYLQQALIAGA